MHPKPDLHSPAGAHSGTALILVLVALLALMMLALPFVFSQSTALSGVASFQGRRSAVSGSQEALDLGLGLASAAQGLHACDPERLHLMLDRDLDEVLGITHSTAILADEPQGVDLDLGRAPLAPEMIDGPFRRRSLWGLSIADESGRLDVNDLDATDWDRLLRAVGIVDWDDRRVPGVDERDDEGVLIGDPSDGNHLGQLAEALARHRFTLPEHRLSHLEQLLDAQPRRAVLGGGWTADGLRPPLHAAELALLAPLLSIVPRPLGRGDLIDLGTVVHGRHVLDSDISDLIAPGTVIAAGPLTAGGSPAKAWRSGNRVWSTAVDGSANPVTGDPVAIRAPAAVNVHHAPPMVLTLLTGRAEPSGDLPFTTWNSLAQAFEPALGASHVTAHWSPIGTGRERPPLALAGAGVVRIRSAAASTDAQERPGASTNDAVLAQALPAERDLIRSWSRQDAFEALRLTRLPARLVTWPQPVDRLHDLLPTNSDAGAQHLGLRFAVQRTLSEASHLPRSWTRLLRGSSGNALRRRHSGSGVAPRHAPDLDALSPEGLRVGAGQVLSYPLLDDDGRGILPAASPPSSQATRAVSLRPAHLAFWLTPRGDWGNDGEVVLLDLRAPYSSQGMPLATVPASTSAPYIDGRLRVDPPDEALLGRLANHLSLSYDPLQRHLVLRLAHAAIPHLADLGPMIVSDDHLTPEIDERALGTLASGQQRPLAPRRPLLDGAGGIRSGAVTELRYRVDLVADQAHLIQLAIADDRPGRLAVIVNGLVGRDMAALIGRGEAQTLEEPGDYLVLPQAFLAEALPERLPHGGVSPDQPTELRLRLPMPELFPNGLADLLPAAGMIRVGDEYISYEALDGNRLLACRRGRRQDTWVAPPDGDGRVDSSIRWPTMPAHAAGTAVVPGGYRLIRPGGQLRRGGASLDQELPVGDPGLGHLVWAFIRPSQANSESASGDHTIDDLPSDEPDGIHELVADPTVIHLDTARLHSAGQWPLHGIAAVITGRNRAGRHYDLQRVFRFDNRGAAAPDVLGRFLAVRQTNWSDWGNENLTVDPSLPEDEQPVVILLSAALAVPVDVDPLDDERYAQPDSTVRFDGSRWQQRIRQALMQLYDPDTGRTEWLRYHRLAIEDDDAYLVNLRGFSFHGYGRGNGERGLERSAGPAAPNGTLWPPFPAGARVLPVQVLGSGVAWKSLATGDVISLMPSDAADGPRLTRSTDGAMVETRGPYQLLVRYAPEDALHGTSAAPSDPTTFPHQHDTHNTHFAFTEELPVAFDMSRFDVVCGNGWTGRDLSPFPNRIRINDSNVAVQPPGRIVPPIPLGTYPWTSHLDQQQDRDGITLPQGRRGDPELSAAWSQPLWLNSFAEDLQARRNDERLVYFGGADQRPERRAEAPPSPGPAWWLDGIVAGPLRALAARQGVISAIDDQRHPWHPGAPGFANSIDAASEPPSPLLAADQLGEIEVDDEQLLEAMGGSEEHCGLLLVNGEVIAFQHREGRRASILARALLGSQARDMQVGDSVLRLPLGPVAVLPLDLPPDFRGPITGLHSDQLPASPAYLAILPDGEREVLTTVLHNGLHHTAPWLRGLYRSRIHHLPAGSVLLGLWPRFPSALPHETQAEHYRSRQHPWASFTMNAFALNLYQSPAIRAEIDLSGNGPWLAEARALAAGWDWHQVPAVPVQPGTVSVDEVFADASRWDRPHDGVELRVHWRYREGELGEGADTQDRSAWERRLLLDLAAAGNQSPTLRRAQLRGRAGTVILERHP